MPRYFSARKALCYVRYMDDFLILTENGYLDLDGFERHPDKTQTGAWL